MAKLNSCHTQADVEIALQQLPIGMEALYDRMAASVAENPSATYRALASAILQCVTCSLRVMTVPELSEALHEEASKILDFQRSIVDLCGGFVVIDNDGNVAMIHQTAREYLLNGDDRPFHVDKDSAHKQMFLSCMRCLMTIGLRAKMKGNQKPEILDYAASSWFSHLASTSLGCEKVHEVLNRFPTGNWVLTWIHILAASQQLRLLIQASKHLSRYCAKQKDDDAVQNQEYVRILKQSFLESWAEDLVKLVGKFGAILRRNPESIYKLIPPFCPKNSVIYQQFGKTKDKSLVVSGLSTANWDDSLASIAFGFGNYASSIMAAGTQIVILISSGNVVLYDSVLFEETAASPIKHGERLYRLKINGAGTLLATYGYRTTKIWEVSTGTCKISVDNMDSRPRPLAMLLTDKNTTLLVGTDDRRIRSLDLNETTPTWQLVAELEEPELEGHFLNSSNYMALNKDGRLIAVAYRGHPLSAWEIDGPVHIGHCWRKREEIARGEVIEAVWHPHYPEVLGLYIEGVVFKWRPYEDENDEIATGGSRLAISGDGNLFATGDARGRVKVYTTSDFRLLYQLVAEDTVLGLVFSPDLHRFYDIRGYYGNAWEPNALMEFAEQRSKGIKSESEAGSLAPSSTAYENWAGRVDSITVLAGSPVGRLYCCGTENGAVHLHSTRQGKLASIYVSKSFLSIEQMSWSDDGQYLCFSDSSKKITVMSIAPSTGDSDPLVETKAEIPMRNCTKGHISQSLIHPNASQLLVRSCSTLCITSLASFSVALSLGLDTNDSIWITHPQDPSLLMGMGPNTIHVLDWSLNERQNYKFGLPNPRFMSLKPGVFQGQNSVDRVLITRDKKHILLQLSLLSQNLKEKSFVYIDTPSWPASTAATPRSDQEQGPLTVKPTTLPHSLTSQITIALSFLSHDKLIFLSKIHSVCSSQNLFRSGQSPSTSCRRPHSSDEAMAIINPTTPFNRHQSHHTEQVAGENVEPLFSLPGDWISKDNLALCSIWDVERSLLCPRNGEVAVVRCTAQL